jgi:hypothetical protein
MKVRELIEKLQQEDPERLVIVSSDEEGNSMNPLQEIATAAYSKEDREIGLETLTDEDKEQGYGEEDVIEDGIPALVLYP